MTISVQSLPPELSLPETAERFRLNMLQEPTSPFCRSDTTAGMEFELQVAIGGRPEDVDLPLTIRQSSFFRNIIKRSERGDCSGKIVDDLHAFLEDKDHFFWENSWVRLSCDCLSPYAQQVFEHDLLADKSRPDGMLRSDRQRFFCIHKGRQWLRLPVSYILKLALVDCLGREQRLEAQVLARGRQLQDHFLSDNTSPEILSLAVVDAGPGTIGRAAAAESARTFLLCQLLMQYANSQFDLRRQGQHGLLYFSPQAPQRQKRLNDLVPDSFYRQLFMSPCLSGWNRGEDKHAYMALCHRTLSRSQLNTIAKLKDAGIITNNLIVLPNTSNTCLANNGTHVSLGSKLLTACAADSAGSGFTPAVEKYYGDLIIKVAEHFLPLLVTTSSAAPYRIDFADFHPEKVLGFLPHELDYTHLRMLWRRWQKKAHNRLFGRPLTPFGPQAVDRVLALLLRAKGDLVPDFRLLDYLVALLSTDTSPGLNGLQGNQHLLMRDLAEMGVFDQRMSIYLPYRLREFSQKGYCGFEGRSYSLFPSLLSDLRDGVELQNLFTAYACRLVLQGRISHADIPDTPQIESERRQIFFATAIGIPTIFLEADSKNRFLSKIVSQVDFKRSSRRYKGYIRVHVREYQLALLRILQEDAPDLVEDLAAAPLLRILKEQIQNKRRTAFGRLTDAIVKTSGRRRAPLDIPASHFNRASEDYYRDELRLDHLREGLSVLIGDCSDERIGAHQAVAGLCRSFRLSRPPAEFIAVHQQDILAETASPDTLRQLIMLCIAALQARQTVQPLS